MFFREYFPVVMRSVAGYVTKGNKRDRKKLKTDCIKILKRKF